MSITIKVTKKLLVISLFIVILIVGAGVAFASYDAELLYVCTKNGSIQVVASKDECKNDETALGLVTEAGLTSLQNTDASLKQQIDDLEALVRRLHGDTAAVLMFASQGGGGPAEEIQSSTYRLVFCDGTDFDPIWDDCMSEYDGFVLESEPVTKDDDGIVFTFTADNSSNFESIVDRLTNGENDYIGFVVENDQGGASANVTSERKWFFPANFSSVSPKYELNTPVSAHLDIIDLAGFDIDKISLVVDYFDTYLEASGGINLAWTNQRSRIFFGLAK